MTTPMPQAPAQQYAPQAPVQDPFAAAQKFLTGGLTAAKWPHVGFVFEGTVTGARITQQTDYDDGTLMFWRDGSPRMQLIVDVQGPATGKTWKGLAYVETPVPNDNGMRAMYVKGKLQAALTQGLRDAGNAEFELGGHVRIERVQNDPPKDSKKEPAHNYRVTWTPAAQNMAPAAQMLAQPADGPAAPQQYQAPAPAAPQQYATPAPQQYAPQPPAASPAQVFAPAPAPSAPANPFAVAGPQTALPGDGKPPF